MRQETSTVSASSCDEGAPSADAARRLRRCCQRCWSTQYCTNAESFLPLPNKVHLKESLQSSKTLRVEHQKEKTCDSKTRDTMKIGNANVEKSWLQIAYGN